MNCNLTEDLLEVIDLSRNVLIRNWYPEKLMVKTLQDLWARGTLKAVLREAQQDV